jgi:tRNA (mo5U34)-methyltransferase
MGAMAEVSDTLSVSPESIAWWHQIELPGGYVTPGPDRSAEKLAGLHLPDLTGKTVLDVGANDGYFSFAAERLGASRVLAADSTSWAWHPPHGKAGFEYARKALDSNVEDIDIEVLDLSPETVGQFDVVFFLGVLYHMRHPLLALERVASVTKELLVMETLVDLTFLRTPAAAFYPWAMCADDSNWWGPNRAAVLGMLRSVGFERTAAYPAKRFAKTRLAGIPARTGAGVKLTATTSSGSRTRLMRDLVKSGFIQSRLVTHAWK